jgi:hypothetical protein
LNSLIASGLGLNEIRVGEMQSRIQTHIIERNGVSQRCDARIVDKWRDSGQRNKPKNLLGERVLQRAYLCAARLVPALSDRKSAERSDVLG